MFKPKQGMSPIFTIVKDALDHSCKGDVLLIVNKALAVRRCSIKIGNQYRCSVSESVQYQNQIRSFSLTADGKQSPVGLTAKQ